MRSLVVVTLVSAILVYACPCLPQGAGSTYYDSVTDSFKRKCAQEGFESCLRFLNDRDQDTQTAIWQRLSEAEKSRIDLYFKAKVKAAQREQEEGQEAQTGQVRLTLQAPGFSFGPGLPTTVMTQRGMMIIYPTPPGMPLWVEGPEDDCGSGSHRR